MAAAVRRAEGSRGLREAGGPRRGTATKAGKSAERATGGHSPAIHAVDWPASSSVETKRRRKKVQEKSAELSTLSPTPRCLWFFFQRHPTTATYTRLSRGQSESRKRLQGLAISARKEVHGYRIAPDGPLAVNDDDSQLGGDTAASRAKILHLSPRRPSWQQQALPAALAIHFSLVRGVASRA